MAMTNKYCVLAQNVLLLCLAVFNKQLVLGPVAKLSKTRRIEAAERGNAACDSLL